MVVQTYIPIELYEQLKALADKEDRSISNYVKKLIEQHVAEKTENKQLNK